MRDKGIRSLIKLYKIYSPSNQEDDMQRYIINALRNWKISYKVDEIGNILATKGKAGSYPCIAVHMDENQDPHPEDYQVHRTGDVLYGFSESQLSQCGLGADDKNGIWVALNLLRKLPTLKVAFFVQEEVGCFGSEAVDLSFFDDVRFVIQVDRKSGSDLIVNANGVALCEQDFIAALRPSQFGYKPCTGFLTDVVTLRERGLAVSACNVSCGYYFPHTDREVTRFSELVNCLNFVEHACVTLTSTYKAKVVMPKNYYPMMADYLGLQVNWDDDLFSELRDEFDAQQSSNDLLRNKNRARRKRF